MLNFFKRRNKKDKYEWQDLKVEPMDSNDSGICECCGNMSRTVWGNVTTPYNKIEAVYFVQWTLSNPEHGANFDLIIGDWGENTTAENRNAVSLIYKAMNNQSGFMVIDSSERPFSQDTSLVSNTLLRDQVINSPIKDIVFTIADAVFAYEPNIQEIREWN